MYKKIVVPIMLLLFILQTNNLLFANENTDCRKETKAKTEATVAETGRGKYRSCCRCKNREKTNQDVVAIVNGEEISRKDFDRRMNVIKRMNQDVTRSVQIQVVNQLAKKVLLKQFVEGQNIDVSDEEVQGELEKIKYFLKSNPNNSEKSLEEILETQGSNISELKGEVRRTLALSKYLDERVSDDEKRSYFEANKSAFNGEKVKASHVLIDTTELKNRR